MPLKLLRNKQMMSAIGAVVGVIKVYCQRANDEDPDAIEVSNKLDAAGREQVLFREGGSRRRPEGSRHGVPA